MNNQKQQTGIMIFHISLVLSFFNICKMRQINCF